MKENTALQNNSFKDNKLYDYNISWREFFKNKNQRHYKTLAISIFYVLLCVIAIKYTYGHLNSRQGVVLDDYVLNMLPGYDITWPIFILLYGLVLCALLRFINKPVWILLGLRMFALINILRMASIELVHLAPPKNLIPMPDPLASLVMQTDFSVIQQDLFFSGHVSNLLMLCIIFRLHDKSWSIYSITNIIGTVVLSLMLLIQHIHYTIDILGAVPAVVILYYLTRYLDRITQIKSPFNGAFK